jgi:hypothetical protein
MVQQKQKSLPVSANRLQQEARHIYPKWQINHRQEIKMLGLEKIGSLGSFQSSSENL